jgi:hypothetical protein
VLTYGRWLLMWLCFVIVSVAGLRLHQSEYVITGAIGAVTCVGGLFIDVFRDKEVRALKEEITIHRRTEARLRNLNQRGRA